MSDASARFGLPHILPSQAQKHVTHNEAIALIDALLHLSLEARDSETPPAAPSDGQAWHLGGAPTGDWTGQAGMIALRQGGGWVFVPPVTGLRAWDVSQNAFVVFDGALWQATGGSGGGAPSFQNLPGVGIGTTSDTTNRLAVASDATLLSHSGGSHQVKVNKATESDTASLLFQSNWTGYAEMGLAGGTDFEVKVSGDGSAWSTALRFDGSSGLVTGDAVQSDASDLTAGKLARVGTTYGPGNLLGSVSQSGGVPAGAVIETNSSANGTYTRWADGTQLCWISDLTLSGNNDPTLDAIWLYPVPFVAPPVVTMTPSLVDADWTGLSRNEVSCWGPGNTPTVTEARLAIYPISGTGNVTGSVANTGAIAVGRWF